MTKGKIVKLAAAVGAVVLSVAAFTACGKKNSSPQKETTTKKAERETEKEAESKESMIDKNKDVTGLKLYYDMTLSEDGKQIVDKSGNGNDGNLLKPQSAKVENNVLYIQDGAAVKLPDGMFEGENNLTISIWVRDYSGSVNTCAMFFGTKEKLPVSYWLLNPCNTAGRMKSVFTNSVNAAAPYNTEAGISPSQGANGVEGPITDRRWGHYVTVITEDSLTGYYNGQKVGTVKLDRTVTDFGENLVAYLGKSSYEDPTFLGYMKELKIYDKALGETEVAALYEEAAEEEGEPTGTKTDIFIADRADPYVTYGNDGYYYFTASYPMRGGADPEGYDRIILRRSKTLEGLRDAEEKVIWDESSSSISYRFIWAPEMHYIGGKWYMYYAASGSAGNVWDINCHVLMCTGDNPYEDPWEEKGKFQAAEGDKFSFTGFSLDMTYFENKGRHYVIWAQNGGNSNLYMAEIDPAEPWKTISKNMLLTKPEYCWERVTIPVNEGPAVLFKDNKVIVAFSASATGPEYCIGCLYADVDSDLLDKSSWTKMETPLLTSEDLVGEYGPGHNSFVTTPEGKVYFVYHSRAQECFDGKCGYGHEDPLYDPCRSARVREVQWDEDGLPILNK